MFHSRENTMPNYAAYFTMIRALIESAFQTGCLSVESEGLLNQVLAAKSYHSEDLAALAALYDAVRAGRVKREASSNLSKLEFPIGHKKS